MSFKGKVAVVTDSNRRIGRAIAIRFAHDGADVASNDSRDEDEAQETLAQVEAESRRGLIVRADLARNSDIQRVIADVLQYFGRLDVLVNNAGIESKVDFLEVGEDDYDAVLGVNLKGRSPRFSRRTMPPMSPDQRISLTAGSHGLTKNSSRVQLLGNLQLQPA